MLIPLAAVLVGATLPALPAHAETSDDVAPAKKTLVELTISGDTSEDPAPPTPFGPSKRNFRARLELLREIARDDSIDGVKLEIGGFPGWAHTADLLVELDAIKASGKKVVCYAEMLTQTDLMFATIADHLVVPPSGMLALEGLTAEAFYMADMFDDFGVKFEVLHVGDFKTAYEDLARDTMSESQRIMLGQILDQRYDQLLGTIAGHRGVERAAVEGLMEHLFVEPDQALAAGVIDAVAYADEFETQVEGLLGGEYDVDEDYGKLGGLDPAQLDNPFAAFSLLGQMLNPPDRDAPDEPHVAVVYATGAITSGDSTADFQGNVSTMGSDTIVEALERCYEDDHVKAVVLRVNSPGGSALASDMIWRAIERVQTKKPVISSMGSVAASGGYWISMGCRAIVAQPGTLTGSIGVVSMLPDVSEVVEDAGVQVEVVARGPHGDQMSLVKYGPTDPIRRALTRSMEVTYSQFLEKVSAGRRMPVEEVAELAGGRVWTGQQAYDNGLVDTLGGLDDAIALACVMGGGLDPSSTQVMEYPDPPNPFEEFEKSLSGAATLPGAARLVLDGLGAGHLGVFVERSMSSSSVLHPERVQALMPFHLRVR